VVSDIAVGEELLVCYKEGGDVEEEEVEERVQEEEAMVEVMEERSVQLERGQRIEYAYDGKFYGGTVRKVSKSRPLYYRVRFDEGGERIEVKICEAEEGYTWRLEKGGEGGGKGGARAVSTTAIRTGITSTASTIRTGSTSTASTMVATAATAATAPAVASITPQIQQSQQTQQRQQIQQTPPQKKKRQDEVFVVGQVVNVEARTSPGVNKQGGIGEWAPSAASADSVLDPYIV
jgi:hypothetical protein